MFSLMQKPKVSLGRILLAATVVAVVFPASLSAQDPSPAAPPPGSVPPPPPDMPPRPPELPDVASMTPEQKQDALRNMGYAMAQSLNLNLGFSDDELSQIFDGMKLAASGAEEPEGFRENMPYAMALYNAKRQEQRAKEEAEAAKLAEAQIAAANAFFEELEKNPNVQKTESGLRYEIIEAGSEKKATATDRVKVNYRGTLIDGTEFDAQMDAANPAQFSVRGVVKGFGEGLQLVGEGGRIKLYIPSDLGYGNRPPPSGKIRPGDALIFDVIVKEVSAPPARAVTPRPPAGARPPGPPPNFTPPPPPNVTPPPPPSTPPPPPPAPAE